MSIHVTLTSPVKGVADIFDGMVSNYERIVMNSDILFFDWRCTRSFYCLERWFLPMDNLVELRLLWACTGYAQGRFEW